MENEQGLLSGLVSEYDLGDLSEEEEEGEDLHRTDEDQDAGTQEGDDQFGADAEEALLRAQVTTSHFTTPSRLTSPQAHALPSRTRRAQAGRSREKTEYLRKEGSSGVVRMTRRARATPASAPACVFDHT